MSKNAIVSFKGNKNINSRIQLTGSKSECNRALIIRALSNKLVEVQNLSNAADTVTLNDILNHLDTIENEHSTLQQTVDVGPAGTAMRFLSAYLSAKKGNFLLTGTERMKQRPIGILTEALKKIGANILHTEENGFPPLAIKGPLHQESNHIKIKGDVSSQYISALLMIAPVLKNGLTLEIEGELTSKPYVNMTLDMLKAVGIEHSWTNNTISINPQAFKPETLIIEPDWSAASYWYSVAALADEATINLPALKSKSLQGDSKIQQIMRIFGIATTKTEEGIEINNVGVSFETDQILNLKSCPDLAQTIITCAAILGRNMSFTGLETLKIKETDRIKALQTELAKFGVKLIEDNLIYTLNCEGLNFPDKVFISTYEDHRMAMAFAPLALVGCELEIEDMDVVSKSYPQFWDDLKNTGFTVEEKN